MDDEKQTAANVFGSVPLDGMREIINPYAYVHIGLKTKASVVELEKILKEYAFSKEDIDKEDLKKYNLSREEHRADVGKFTILDEHCINMNNEYSFGNNAYFEPNKLIGYSTGWDSSNLEVLEILSLLRSKITIEKFAVRRVLNVWHYYKQK